jgi:lipopolysaccharide export system ATP-binding protein
MGNILLEGPSEFLVRDEKAKEIYLGPQFSM